MIKKVFLSVLITSLIITIGYASSAFKDLDREQLPGVEMTLVTLENCEPGTWVGMVRWLNNKTDYEDVPDAEIKQSGTLNVWLPVGDYAITHYRPREVVRIVGGGIFVSPAKIIEFREVEVGMFAVTFSFGCEE